MRGKESQNVSFRLLLVCDFAILALMPAYERMHGMLEATHGLCPIRMMALSTGTSRVVRLPACTRRDVYTVSVGSDFPPQRGTYDRLNIPCVVPPYPPFSLDRQSVCECQAQSG